MVILRNLIKTSDNIIECDYIQKIERHMAMYLSTSKLGRL